MDNRELTASRTGMSVRAKALWTLLGVTAAVVLPQLLHTFGIATGLGTLPGEVYLPMHLPVILVALIAGPAAGIAAGAFGPLVSSALTGMPAQAMLPFMMIELAAYGLSAGVLGRWALEGNEGEAALKTFVATLTAQVIGRLAKWIAIMAAFYGLGIKAIPPEAVLSGIKTGIPGIIIQLLALPLLIYIYSKVREKRAGE